MAVEDEEVLWNVASRTYRDRDLTCAAYAMVARNVQFDAEECQLKYKAHLGTRIDAKFSCWALQPLRI